MKTTKFIFSLAAAVMTLAAAPAQQSASTTKGGGDVSIADCQQPLYIVDGRAVDTDAINSIDPSQIESITVYKDKANLDRYAIFGDVSHGVIVITLKSKDETVYTSVDQNPAFLGGDINTFRQWVMQQMRYPAQAMEQNIQGNVVVKFIIGKDGLIELSNIEILSSPSEILSEEVVRVMKNSPAWTPGKQEGKSARVSFVMPVSFRMVGSSDEQVNLDGKNIKVIKNDSGDSDSAITITYNNQVVDEIVVVGFGKK